MGLTGRLNGLWLSFLLLLVSARFNSTKSFAVLFFVFFLVWAAISRQTRFLLPMIPVCLCLSSQAVFRSNLTKHHPKVVVSIMSIFSLLSVGHGVYNTSNWLKQKDEYLVLIGEVVSKKFIAPCQFMAHCVW